MGQIAYIVSEIAFHYDHDIYRRLPCDRSVIPLAVYSSKESAKFEADRLNIEALRQTQIDQYGYCIEDLFHDSSYWRGGGGNMSRVIDILSSYGIHGGSHLTELDEAIKHASDDELVMVADLMHVKFYSVIEADFRN